jgi:hypothetical protein
VAFVEPVEQCSADIRKKIVAAGIDIGVADELIKALKEEKYLNDKDMLKHMFGVINILKKKDEQQSRLYINSYDKIRNNSSFILFGLNIPITQN